MKATMEHNNNWFYWLGAGGGLTKYLLQINVDVPFMQKLFEAGITALLCGFLGMAGKWLFDIVKEKLKKKK